MTLARALEGITTMLRESHGERHERLLDKLIRRLTKQGFDTSSIGRRVA